MERIKRVRDNVYLVKDTCNVYVIRDGDAAVLIDFGDGDALELLGSIGVQSVSAILMTHHHRDQAQGLAKAHDCGIPIYVPHTERDLFDRADEHWASRQVHNNYNVRQDRFTLLHSVPVASTLRDYETCLFNGRAFHIVPTPGHTTGSITILTDLNGELTAFCGDLIYDAGKVWSLSATQWNYNSAEGVNASLLSLLDLQDRQVSLLLPSHGAPMDDAAGAITKLADHFIQLLEVRHPSSAGDLPADPSRDSSHAEHELLRLRNRPYVPITPHLLHNRTSVAHSYAVLSDSGKALLIDYGYDFGCTFMAAGTDRASRRPWLYNIAALKRQYGVTSIDVVLPTHYHDDHVAGLNLLRDVEGAQVWAADNFADILTSPDAYDLPCIWYEPIPTDRVIPLNRPFQWEEYTFTLHEQPGHTLYAVAISFEADGKRVLAIGDQQENQPHLWNYVYQNGFRYGDYVQSAELYLRLQPDLIISGHWDPFRVAPELLTKLLEQGKALERAHRLLLPTEECDMGANGFIARLNPYMVTTDSGGQAEFTAEVRNPYAHDAEAKISVVLPSGWTADRVSLLLVLPGSSTGKVSFVVSVPDGIRVERERLAVDVTVDHVRFGQQAEALVTVI